MFGLGSRIKEGPSKVKDLNVTDVNPETNSMSNSSPAISKSSASSHTLAPVSPKDGSSDQQKDTTNDSLTVYPSG